MRCQIAIIRLCPKLLLIVVCACLSLAATAAERVIEARHFHLGKKEDPEFDFFEKLPLDGQRLDLRFDAKANPSEASLFLWQDDLKQDWIVRLNGRNLGTLFLMEAPLVHTLTVPAGSLRDGENILSIIPPKGTDDIFVGEFRLDDRPPAKAIEQSHLQLRAFDPIEGRSIPCRFTIVNDRGALTPIWTAPSSNLAVRPGVIYSGNGYVMAGVPAGTYTIFATRGFEYGLASNQVTIAAGETRSIRMPLKREVPTPGLVACDTHVHTFSLSGHGDATLQERAVTLAGEGIELPIATDHNLLSDYSMAATQTALRVWFTPVIGDEVTTKTAHFNIFPMLPGSHPPDEKQENWAELLRNMRATPGVEVVVLNHPLNTHNNFQPFASTNFNRVTGDSLRVLDFGEDAVELVNSSALQSEFMRVFEGWFALLNAGHRLTGVGSSDVHDVSRYIVGQGRTYISCPDTQPAQIDVHQACENLKNGRALVSMGLLTDMKVEQHFGVGSLATNLPEEFEVSVTVLGPSWISADTVELFANGIKVREAKIEPTTNVEKAHQTWKLPRPHHDQYLVAIATGPGVRAPYWAISRPYQPSSKSWNPQVIGATNPIWLDADRDGKFSSAREYASSLIRKSGNNAEQLMQDLAPYDQAVSAQAAGLWQKARNNVKDPALQKLLPVAAPAVQAGFNAFASTLP